jgi:hypothetical protein
MVNEWPLRKSPCMTEGNTPEHDDQQLEDQRRASYTITFRHQRSSIACIVALITPQSGWHSSAASLHGAPVVWRKDFSGKGALPLNRVVGQPINLGRSIRGECC